MTSLIFETWICSCRRLRGFGPPGGRIIPDVLLALRMVGRRSSPARHAVVTGVITLRSVARPGPRRPASFRRRLGADLVAPDHDVAVPDVGLARPVDVIVEHKVIQNLLRPECRCGFRHFGAWFPQLWVAAARRCRRSLPLGAVARRLSAYAVAGRRRHSRAPYQGCLPGDGHIGGDGAASWPYYCVAGFLLTALRATD